MQFPYKAILFDWAYTLVDLVCEDDRAAFIEMMNFLKENDVKVPQFEAIFSSYRNLLGFFEQLSLNRLKRRGIVTHFICKKFDYI